MLHILKAPEFVGRPEKYINKCTIEAIKKAGVKHKVYSADLNATQSVEDLGACYDNDLLVKGSVRQIQEVMKYFEEGDDILSLEGFNPALIYFRMMNKKVGKIGALFHSSTAIKVDMFAKTQGLPELEKAILTALDFRFCATWYLGNKLKEVGNNCSVNVVGLPFDVDVFKEVRANKNREKEVIFNHRWAEDKRPEMFIELAKAVPSYKFVVLTPYKNIGKEIEQEIKDIPNMEVRVCGLKEQYFENLKHASHIFSAALLETFGYSVMEGVASGCIPILTDTACYSEMYPSKYIGKSIRDLENILAKVSYSEVLLLSGLIKFKNSSKNIAQYYR